MSQIFYFKLSLLVLKINGQNRGKLQKVEYLKKNEKRVIGEMKNIFHNFKGFLSSVFRIEYNILLKWVKMKVIGTLFSWKIEGDAKQTKKVLNWSQFVTSRSMS